MKRVPPPPPAIPPISYFSLQLTVAEIKQQYLSTQAEIKQFWRLRWNNEVLPSKSGFDRKYIL